MPSSWGRCGPTPEWATTGRDGSARSSTRLTSGRGRCGSTAGSWPAEGRAQRVGARGRPVGLVVAAPQGDRGVVAEEVDHGPGLARGLPADAAGVRAVQRQVLPQQQAGLVGGVVELGPGDVGLDPQQVEAQPDGPVDVGSHLVRGGLAEGPSGRAVLGALEEQALAVHARDPPAQPDRPQADPEAPLVADGAFADTPGTPCARCPRRPRPRGAGRPPAGRGARGRPGPGATTGRAGRRSRSTPPRCCRRPGAGPPRGRRRPPRSAAGPAGRRRCRAPPAGRARPARPTPPGTRPAGWRAGPARSR